MNLASGIRDLAGPAPRSTEQQELLLRVLARATALQVECLQLSTENLRLTSALESVRRHAESRHCDCARVLADPVAARGSAKTCEREVPLSCPQDRVPALLLAYAQFGAFPSPLVLLRAALGL